MHFWKDISVLSNFSSRLTDFYGVCTLHTHTLAHNSFYLHSSYIYHFTLNVVKAQIILRSVYLHVNTHTYTRTSYLTRPVHSQRDTGRRRFRAGRLTHSFPHCWHSFNSFLFLFHILFNLAVGEEPAAKRACGGALYGSQINDKKY